MTFRLIGVAEPEQRDGYRSSHSSADYGVIYDRTYEAGYYAALWSKIEKPLIATILRDLGGAEMTCLDFACGTGRITQVAADYFGKVVGVDVSASMLARAHGSHNVRLRRIDITRRRLGETFDVVTAFRFLLNAEQELRQEALQAIREHLKPEGRLICNIHMNATSPIGIAARIANRLPWSCKRNTMSTAELSRLLDSAGFTVERTLGYGYLPRPGRLLPGFCEVCIEPAERLAAAARMPARCAQQFLVVAKRKETEEKEYGPGAASGEPDVATQHVSPDPLRKLRLAMALPVFGGVGGFVVPIYVVGGVRGFVLAIGGLMAGVVAGCANSLLLIRYF